MLRDLPENVINTSENSELTEVVFSLKQRLVLSSQALRFVLQHQSEDGLLAVQLTWGTCFLPASKVRVINGLASDERDRLAGSSECSAGYRPADVGQLSAQPLLNLRAVRAFIFFSRDISWSFLLPTRYRALSLAWLHLMRRQPL